MAAVKSKERFPYWETVKINWKANTVLSFAVSCIWLLLTPVLVGTENLDQQGAAVPLEMFVSLIGIILLTPVFLPEQNAEIHDLVASKYVSVLRIYLIRTVYLAVILAAAVGVFVVFMGMRGCEVNVKLAAGTFSDAIFLGGLGMFASAVCGNTVAAYMIPIGFYVLNYGMGSRLGCFWLFSMTMGEYLSKVVLLAAGILLIGGSLLLQKGRSIKGV